MKNFRVYFHLILAVAAAAVGGLSLWKMGWSQEGKSYPNTITILMMVMVISQVGMMWEAIKDKRKVEKKEP